MNIPRYWAKGRAEAVDAAGKTMVFTCWGWSQDSSDEAGVMGQARSDRAAERFVAGTQPERYAYSDRPLREEIIADLTTEAAGHTLVTRNSYGSTILNSAGAMFVDVDLPEEDVPTVSLGGLFQRLFGKKPEPAPTPCSKEKEALAILAETVGALPGCGVRIYRTRAGLRYLFTHKLYTPEAAETTQLMEQLTADPLYVTLCRAQKCFRARLSPKPWRCGLSNPATRFPRGERAEARFRQWLGKYESITPDFATCDFVSTLGNPVPHPALTDLVEHHDQQTQAHTDYPLA